MAQTILFKTPTMFRDLSENVVVDINVAPTKITFKLTSNYVQNSTTVDIDGTETQQQSSMSDVIYDFELNLETLKSIKRFSSNTLFGVSLTPSYADKVLDVKQIVNLSEMTKPLRLDTSFSSKLSFGNSSQPFLQILVKDPEGTFNDHDIILIGNNDITVTSNKTFNEGDYSTYVTTQLLDPITITKDATYTSEEYVQYVVNTASYVDQVYLEQIFGVINKSRVNIDSEGKGYFRILKSSVDSDGIKLKAGYLSYTGLFTLTDTL